MALNYVTLTGKILDGTGGPVGGTVTFEPTSDPWLTDATDTTLFAPAKITRALAQQSGTFSVPLLATDNASPLPAGWAWTVTISPANTTSLSFSFPLPFSGGATQDISQIAPITSVSPQAPYVLSSGGTMTGALILPTAGKALAAGGGSWVVYGPGGGSTDDAAALAALANAMTGGGTIVLDAGGAYNWATPQSITAAGVTVVGAGWLQSNDTHGSVLKAAAGWSSSSPMLTLAGEGCRLLGVQVSGNSLAANLIAVTGSNCRLTDSGTRSPATGGVCLDIQAGGISCWVIGGRYNGLATGSTGIQVNDTDAIIAFTKPVNQATGIKLLSGASGAQVIGNHITPGATGGNCIWASGSASNILIQGNRFDNTPIAPVQLSPASFPHNYTITGNISYTSYGGSSPVIGYDTSAASIRDLLVSNNTAYVSSGSVPTFFLDAITQAGTAATNTSRVASGGTQVVGNSAYVASAAFWGSAPTVAAANMVSTDGTTWTGVPDLGGVSAAWSGATATLGTPILDTTNTTLTATQPNVRMTTADAGSPAFAARVSADTSNRFRLNGDGGMKWGPGNATQDCTLDRQAANVMEFTGCDLDIATAGRGLQVKEGTNAKMGTATANGTTAVTVSTTAVTSSSRIFLTAQNPNAGTPGALYVNGRTAGTSFTFKSTSAADASTVAWFIVEPG